MTKALLKKQIMEAFAWVYRNQKTGKNRSKSGAILVGVFYFALIYGVLGSMFYAMADSLCAPLMEASLSWMYFAITGLVTVALGVFGSVFNTYAGLYQAKDNDLLLSMPIPIRRILTIRLLGVYLTGVMYELAVIVPVLLVWFLEGGSLWALQLPFVLSVLVLALACILGWVVALVASKVRNKNAVTVVLSLVCIGGYYYLYGNAYNMLAALLANPVIIGEKMKTFLYPLYHMGMGAAGNVRSVFVFMAIVLLLFFLVCLVLSHSFLKIATANKGVAKVKYKEKSTKASSVENALLRKELRRFLGSANYMLNCGLGLVVMVIGAGAMLLNHNMVTAMLADLTVIFGSSMPLLAAALICMMTCMCDMSAPSVSLEGKNIWLVQSLPVRGRQVLTAKLKMHLILTMPPSMFLTIVALWFLRPAWYYAILIPVTVAAFILFLALLGLFLNLKMPNLNWTSEIVPIKQSMAVIGVLLGGWAMILIFAGIYFLLNAYVSALFYLLCVTVLLLGLAVCLSQWMKKTGEKIFAVL
ncbi:MAG: hypothetical protein ACI4DR_02535 [Roseburia sp.]